MSATQDLFAQVKSQLDIVEVISTYVDLKQHGEMTYIGLCPFHTEKTPSFNVNQKDQFFHCFGCGKGGDLINFVADYQGISSYEAAKTLAQDLGIVISERQEPVADRLPNRNLYDIHEKTAYFYQTILMTTKAGQAARSYLYERGFDDALIEKFGIGFAPDDKQMLYHQPFVRDYSEVDLLDSGLFVFGQEIGDFFRNRIIFPIFNDKGKVVAFSGRIFGKDAQQKSQAKYKNSPATKIFDKSQELYYLDKAQKAIRQNKSVYLVEGFMDVIALAKVGAENVVATMGTALTTKHIERLARLTKHFILLYDGDKAGQKAIAQAIHLLSTDPSRDVEVIKLPAGMDPDEYEGAYPGMLAQMLEQARHPSFEFLLAYEAPDNLANLQQQIAYIDQRAPQIARFASLTQQDAYIRKLADLLPDFSYDQVEERVHSYRGDTIPIQEAEYPDFPDYGPALDMDSYEVPPIPEPIIVEEEGRPSSYSALELLERHLLNRMIYHPDIITTFHLSDGFQLISPQYEAIFAKIVEEYAKTSELNRSLLADKLSPDLQKLYYSIMMINLPDSLGEGEIADILRQLRKSDLGMQLADLKQQLQLAKQAKNDILIMELTMAIINLTKVMQKE